MAFFQFLKFSGRLKCPPFLGWYLGAWLAVVAAAVLMNVFTTGTDPVMWPVVAGFIITGYIQIAAFVARLKDTGRDPWAIFWLLVPVWSLIYFIMVAFDRSEPERRDFVNTNYQQKSEPQDA
ncbi:MAG: DUF805 domain-containing protein [Chloroflexi bacterium]|nr:DUF805 domain-containing protein [Chloroflexota bacterium]